MVNFFANIFGYVLNYIYNLVNNYGLAIIIFTFLLKLIMLPISISQQKTMKKSSKIQALTKEIQDKYSNDPQKANQEIAELYKQEKMNPLSGCLSSILQIIIILSMFYIVSSPLTYMKKVDEPLIDEYNTRIMHESETKPRYKQIAIIKKYAREDDRLKINMEFLGLDLSDTPIDKLNDWKVYIIPVLYILTSTLSMKINNKMNKKEKEEKSENNEKIITDNQNTIELNNSEKEENKKEEYTQEEMMNDMSKNMGYIMPIMTISIAFVAPLGLAMYWFLNNALAIIERIIINKFVVKDEE